MILVQLAQWFQRRRCLKMLTDRWTDDRVTGILIAHLGAFGSDKQISKMLSFKCFHKPEFRESDVLPGKTEVKQGKFVEFISPG